MLHLVSRFGFTCVFPTSGFLKKTGPTCELHSGDREPGPNEPTELNLKKNHWPEKSLLLASGHCQLPAALTNATERTQTPTRGCHDRHLWVEKPPVRDWKYPQPSPATEGLHPWATRRRSHPQKRLNKRSKQRGGCGPLPTWPLGSWCCQFWLGCSIRRMETHFQMRHLTYCLWAEPRPPWAPSEQLNFCQQPVSAHVNMAPDRKWGPPGRGCVAH